MKMICGPHKRDRIYEVWYTVEKDAGSAEEEELIERNSGAEMGHVYRAAINDEGILGGIKASDLLNLLLGAGLSGAQTSVLRYEYLGLLEVLKNIDKYLASDTIAKLLPNLMKGGNKISDTRPRRRQASRPSKYIRDRKKRLAYASSSKSI